MSQFGDLWTSPRITASLMPANPLAPAVRSGVTRPNAVRVRRSHVPPIHWDPWPGQYGIRQGQLDCCNRIWLHMIGLLEMKL